MDRNDAPHFMETNFPTLAPHFTIRKVQHGEGRGSYLSYTLVQTMSDRSKVDVTVKPDLLTMKAYIRKNYGAWLGKTRFYEPAPSPLNQKSRRALCL